MLRRLVLLVLGRLVLLLRPQHRLLLLPHRLLRHPVGRLGLPRHLRLLGLLLLLLRRLRLT